MDKDTKNGLEIDPQVLEELKYVQQLRLSGNFDNSGNLETSDSEDNADDQSQSQNTNRLPDHILRAQVRKMQELRRENGHNQDAMSASLFGSNEDKTNEDKNGEENSVNSEDSSLLEHMKQDFDEKNSKRNYAGKHDLNDPPFYGFGFELYPHVANQVRYPNTTILLGEITPHNVKDLLAKTGFFPSLLVDTAVENHLRHKAMHIDSEMLAEVSEVERGRRQNFVGYKIRERVVVEEFRVSNSSKHAVWAREIGKSFGVGESDSDSGNNQIQDPQEETRDGVEESENSQNETEKSHHSTPEWARTLNKARAKREESWKTKEVLNPGEAYDSESETVSSEYGTAEHDNLRVILQFNSKFLKL